MTDELKRWRDQIERRAEAMERASIENANHALKAMLLLNGGACIAILAFLSSAYTADSLNADQPQLIAAFIKSLSAFAWGAGCAVLASAIAYLTNSFYARAMLSGRTWEWRTGTTLNWIAVIAGIFSLGLFACGVHLIQSALT